LVKTTAPVPHDHFKHRRPVQLGCLGDDEVEFLHGASLEILQRYGVRFHSEAAVGLFGRGGADVSDGNLVRIPPHLVEWALRAAPKNVAIFDRNGGRAMSLGGGRSYFGPGSDAANTYDLATRQRRPATLNDVVAATRLVDALPNIDFAMSQFMPCDVAAERYERAQMATMLRETTKPVVFVGLDRMSTVYSIQMATSVAGGLDELVRRPFVINYVNFTSPFVHNEESVERLLYAAERNLPSVYTPGRARGSEVPMTEAGAIALVNAGQLAGLVLSQLAREGSPFIWSSPNGGGLDLRSMMSLYAAPDAGPAAWGMAHHYGLPIFGFAGVSDSKGFDTQAAAEATLSLWEATLFGANLVHDIGLLDNAMTGSLELVAFCDEVIGWLRQYLRRVEISEETLALDVIACIAPQEGRATAGTFLDREHTLRHLRETWQPTIFDRRPHHRWLADGARSAEERANRRVRDILESHCAEPLDPRVAAKLDEIVAAD
jgi:trimethylamine---corrinoid protein Co-methyltransferase